MGGNWLLLPISFVEEWSLDKCREEASAIANNLSGDMIDYGAFEGTDLIGYITVGTERLGTKRQYVQLVTFQVSEPFRGMGVGRKLFEKAAGVARAKESQAAYKALGCVHAEEIIPWIADEEPFDVQLEYVL